MSGIEAARERLVVFLIVTALSSCDSTRHLEDLQTPALVWTQGNGLCSKIIAVDGGGGVWKEQGCEDGRPDLREVRRATRAQQDELWALFEMLPFDGSATRDACAGRLLHGFERLELQTPLVTAACAGSQYDDLNGLPEPFRRLAEALLRLQ
jgi:hypothetical protein